LDVRKMRQLKRRRSKKTRRGTAEAGGEPPEQAKITMKGETWK
jgi:hypothetical protein